MCKSHWNLRSKRMRNNHMIMIMKQNLISAVCTQLELNDTMMYIYRTRAVKETSCRKSYQICITLTSHTRTLANCMCWRSGSWTLPSQHEQPTLWYKRVNWAKPSMQVLEEYSMCHWLSKLAAPWAPVHSVGWMILWRISSWRSSCALVYVGCSSFFTPQSRVGSRIPVVVSTVWLLELKLVVCQHASTVFPYRSSPFRVLHAFSPLYMALCSASGLIISPIPKSFCLLDKVHQHLSKKLDFFLSIWDWLWLLPPTPVSESLARRIQSDSKTILVCSFQRIHLCSLSFSAALISIWSSFPVAG